MSETPSLFEHAAIAQSPLHVLREKYGDYELVGSITHSGSHPSFSYDHSYLASPDAAPVSASLPLQTDAFSESDTEAFFDGILPEGSMRKYIARCAHLEEWDYLSFIEILNNESAGALVFKTENDESSQPAYLPLSSEDIVSFAHRPDTIAFDINGRARLSIAGAQSKIGVNPPLQNVGDATAGKCGAL